MSDLKAFSSQGNICDDVSLIWETIELKPAYKHRQFVSLWANIGSLVLIQLDLCLNHRLS